MPDTLNKQSLVNLLIDSPLREPIKINLIDIVNNTAEPDLPKVYSTIIKELEIFQKATERRMKLADETIAKLGGTATPSAPVTAPSTPTPSLPPLDLPPLPQTPVMPQPPVFEPSQPSLSVPPLDLPPLPTTAPSPSAMPAMPAPQPESTPATTTDNTSTPQPLGTPPMASTSDEDALAEIQKELDSLKSSTASEISSAATPAPSAPVAPVQQ